MVVQSMRLALPPHGQLYLVLALMPALLFHSRQLDFSEGKLRLLNTVENRFDDYV